MPAKPTKKQLRFAWHLRAGHTPAEAFSLAGMDTRWNKEDPVKLAQTPMILRLIEAAKEYPVDGR